MTDLVRLPKWTEPDSLEGSREAIYGLSRSMAENAYAIGKHLIWIKGRVGHGAFLPWLRDNLRAYSERTARNLMRFAERCEAAGLLEEYHPGKTATVADLSAGRDAAGKLNAYLGELHRLRHELVDLDSDLDTAWTVEDLADIQKQAKKISGDAAEIKIRCEREVGELLMEMYGFFGFAPTPNQLPAIIRACQDRIEELRAAS